MVPREAIVDMREIAKLFTVKVRIKHGSEWHRRLRFGMWIMRIGAWVTGCEGDIELVKR